VTSPECPSFLAWTSAATGKPSSYTVEAEGGCLGCEAARVQDAAPGLASQARSSAGLWRAKSSGPDGRDLLARERPGAHVRSSAEPAWGASRAQSRSRQARTASGSGPWPVASQVERPGPETCPHASGPPAHTWSRGDRSPPESLGEDCQWSGPWPVASQAERPAGAHVRSSTEPPNLASVPATRQAQSRSREARACRRSHVLLGREATAAPGIVRRGLPAFRGCGRWRARSSGPELRARKRPPAHTSRQAER